MRPTTWKEHKEQLLADPKVRAEYERLRPEFEIAMQIIRYRLKNKMTQAELAEKANIKQAVISRLESGSNNTTIKELSKVFTALGKELKIQVR
jgi:predicted transcriptional regulator